MGGRRKDVRVLPGKESRGPGAYNAKHNPVKKNGPSYGFAKNSKSGVPDVYGHTPAPDQYNPSVDQTKNKAANWGMGSGNRPALSKPPPTPGPGQYNPPKPKEKGPTMGAKDKAYLKQSPGPGQYTPNTASVK